MSLFSLSDLNDDLFRRIKSLAVSTDEILSLFLPNEEYHRTESNLLPTLRHVYFDDVPVGTRVLRVDYNFLINMFVFVVCHPSFPLVPPGEKPPMSLGKVIHCERAVTVHMSPLDPG